MLETTPTWGGIGSTIAWCVGVGSPLASAIWWLRTRRREGLTKFVQDRIGESTIFVRADVQQARDEASAEILERIEAKVTETGEHVRVLDGKVDQLQIDVAKWQAVEEARRRRLPHVVSSGD